MQGCAAGALNELWEFVAETDKSNRVDVRSLEKQVGTPAAGRRGAEDRVAGLSRLRVSATQTRDACPPHPSRAARCPTAVRHDVRSVRLCVLRASVLKTGVAT